MSWDHYRYFLAVAETGSLSAAARQLAVSQPTVGRQISELEDKLEARLFERASHGYMLTSAGRQILEKIEQASSAFQDVERQVRGMDKALSGRIRISATEGLGSYWLTPALSEFHAAYPSISFELLLNISLVNMRNREADIALRLANPRVSDLIGRKLGKIGFGLYGADNYFDKKGVPASMSDLVQHDFVGWREGAEELDVSTALNRIAKGGQITIRCNTVAAQISAVSSGMGLFLAPHYMVPQDGRFMRLLTEEVDHRIDIWLLTHRDLVNTQRVRTLLDFVYEKFRQDKEMLEYGFS
ncbi:MAG: LysR family transcriptional regulator [Proteobacteria bacterium]|nr:LysR family transcriptional regulator [Pseudomonadota bacterium]